MRHVWIGICLCVSLLTGCSNPVPDVTPLAEEEVTRLMAEKMDIKGCVVSKHGETYSFSFSPPDPNAEGITYEVNASSGTVYEKISGMPQTNVKVKDAPNFIMMQSGTQFKAELFKLANQVLEKKQLVPANDEWISGGCGDGYICGEVKKGAQTFVIRLDVFTQDWAPVEK